MDIVYLRVLEVTARSHWLWRVVQGVGKSRRHFRLNLSYRWIDVLSQDEEVIRSSSLDFLNTNGQMVLHVVFAYSREGFVQLPF